MEVYQMDSQLTSLSGLRMNDNGSSEKEQQGLMTTQKWGVKNATFKTEIKGIWEYH